MFGTCGWRHRGHREPRRTGLAQGSGSEASPFLFPARFSVGDEWSGIHRWSFRWQNGQNCTRNANSYTSTDIKQLIEAAVICTCRPATAVQPTKQDQAQPRAASPPSFPQDAAGTKDSRHAQAIPERNSATSFVETAATVRQRTDPPSSEMDPLPLNSTESKRRSPSAPIGEIGSEFPEHGSILDRVGPVTCRCRDCRGGDIDVRAAILKRICFGDMDQSSPGDGDAQTRVAETTIQHGSMGAGWNGWPSGHSRRDDGP